MRNRLLDAAIILGVFRIVVCICFLVAFGLPSYADESCEVFRFRVPKHLGSGVHEVNRYRTDREHKIESIRVNVSNGAVSKPYIVSNGVTLPQRPISALPAKVKACMQSTPVKNAVKSLPVMKEAISFCDERIKCCFIIWCTPDFKKCVSAHAYWS